MSAPLRVLLVEDNQNDAALLLRELRRGNYEVTCKRVETAEHMAQALEQETWDLVLSDYTLPTFDATAALALLQQSMQDLPFIILSGSIREDLAVNAMKAGAHDFISKDNLARLLPAITRELREAGERRARRQAEHDLQAHEARFRSLIEHVSDVIMVLTLEGQLSYISPSVERILGYRPEELLERSLTSLVHPSDQPRITAFLDRVRRQNGCEEPVALEFQCAHRDGGWRVLDAIASGMLNDPGVHGIVLNARDATERKQTELRIKHQLDRLAALRTIDMAITASMDLRVSLSVVLDQVTTHLGVDAGDILLLNEQTQTLAYAAGRGFRDASIVQAKTRLGRGCAGRVALERRTIHVGNLAETDAFQRTDLLKHEEFVAYYGVPLIAKGQVKGVLEVFHRAPLLVDGEWLDFLETLAGQAAIAIDNALLFEGMQRSNTELMLAYDTTLEGWSRALDLRDHETEGHTQRVTDITLHLAHAMNVSNHEMVHIRRGALLHDIGKMGIPDKVLRKPGPLDDNEWAIMRQHPVYAYELLAPIEYLRPAIDIPYCHHERWDGGGYPRGLRGETIPLAARIFSVVDVWDALRSDRPYRRAWPEDRVREHIRSMVGVSFDPQIAAMFLQLRLD